MKRSTITTAIVAAALALGACTRIETGHVGIRTTFNGTVEQQELGVGFHQTMFGSVEQVVANEITLGMNDLHPQTKDRTVLSDLDLTFTYSAEPGSIAELMTKYKGRNLRADGGDIYPVGAYVMNVVTTATTDVIAHYDALEANEKRDEIRQGIRTRVDEILKEEGLQGKIRVHQVFIKNLQIAGALQQSALAVITQTNLLEAKKREVETAKKEAERMEAIARTSDTKYVTLLNAQSNARIADAVAAGKVHTIILPYDFKGMVNIK